MLNGSQVTDASLTADELESLKNLPAQRIMLQDVVKAACIANNLKPRELFSMRRTKGLVDARHEAMYLARELTLASFPMIGRAFYRDHTSVLHGVRKVEKMLSNDEELSARLKTMQKIVERIRDRRRQELEENMFRKADTFEIRPAVMGLL